MRKGLLLTVSLALLLAVGLGAAQLLKAQVIQTNGDTYIATNRAVATSSDPNSLRQQNFGHLDFVRDWYLSNAKGGQDVASVGLFKFNLDSLKGKDIQSAHLQLYATVVNLTDVARLVDVHLADSNWNESTVTFDTRPAWGPNPIATTAVYGANVWYSWDVTGSVQDQAKNGGDISFVTGLRNEVQGQQEQVVFASLDSGQDIPELVVTYTASAAIPIYYWIGGIAGAAVIFFFLGWQIPRLFRRRRVAPVYPTYEEEPESPNGEDDQTL